MHLHGGTQLAEELDINAELQNLMVLVHEFRAPLALPQGKGLGSIMLSTPPPLTKYSTRRYNAFLVTNPFTGRSAISGVTIPFKVDETVPVDLYASASSTSGAFFGTTSTAVLDSVTSFSGVAAAFRRVFVVELLDDRGESCVWGELPVDLVGERTRPVRSLPMQPELSLADFGWQMIRNCSLDFEIERKDFHAETKRVILSKVDCHLGPNMETDQRQKCHDRHPSRGPRRLRDGVTLVQCLAGPSAIPHKPILGSGTSASSASRRRSSLVRNCPPAAGQPGIDSTEQDDQRDASLEQKSPSDRLGNVAQVYRLPIPRSGVGASEHHHPSKNASLENRPPFDLRFAPTKPARAAANRRVRTRRQPADPATSETDHCRTTTDDREAPPEHDHDEGPSVGRDHVRNVQVGAHHQSVDRCAASTEVQDEVVTSSQYVDDREPKPAPHVTPECRPSPRDGLLETTENDALHGELDEGAGHPVLEDRVLTPVGNTPLGSRHNSLPRLRRDDSTRTARTRPVDERGSVTSAFSYAQGTEGILTPQRAGSFGKGLANSCNPYHRNCSTEGSLVTPFSSFRRQTPQAGVLVSPGKGDGTSKSQGGDQSSDFLDDFTAGDVMHSAPMTPENGESHADHHDEFKDDQPNGGQCRVTQMSHDEIEEFAALIIEAAMASKLSTAST